MPNLDLTLVMLSNGPTPSATTRLGYGSPLNSPVVTAFVKCSAQSDGVPATSIDYTSDPADIEERLGRVTASSGSRLYLEETFSYAMLMKLLPADLPAHEAQAWGLLNMVDRHFPDFLDQRRVEAFDLLSRFAEPAALRLGARLSTEYESTGTYHPIKSFYSGRIYERLGDTTRAMRFYEAVADHSSFPEQPAKHTALLTLGRYYAASDPGRAEGYLEALAQYKEMIGVRDDEYEEAIMLLDSVSTREGESR